MKIAHGVSIFLLKDGKILLQHRDKNPPHNPNMWGSFGGAIEKGETPLQAAKREMFEELEYKLDKSILLEEYDYHDKEYNNVGKIFIFVEEYDKTQKLKLNEGDGMKWFTLEEAKKLKTNKIYLEMFEKLDKLNI